eukprot:scaffold554_cov33-Tisochrysis_lutea.AAC.1
MQGADYTLTAEDRRSIFKEAYELAFSINNMRDSWAVTGFEQRAPHGFVCTRRVWWQLKREEAKRQEAIDDAGLTTQLNWSVLQAAGAGASQRRPDADAASDGAGA